MFVNDGSTEGSGELLDKLNERDARVKVVHLSRNFGHQAALQAGLDAAAGAAVVLMDADLQDRPEMVEAFVARWREGYEVVYAVRRQRKEGIAKRAAYALFYRTLHAIADIDVAVDAGDFCLLDRRVVDVLVALPEQHRFLRGLRGWVGFRQIGVPCERDSRWAGTSKYTLRKLFRLALSGYIGFSAAPLRLAALLGLVASLVGFGVAVWVLATKLLDIPSPRGWASLLACVMLVGGVQLLVLGVIGEYLGRVYDEVRRRPTYVLRNRVGFDAPAPAAERRATTLRP
jgi:polyisoprenyl-phosphate glycosyltransferase